LTKATRPKQQPDRPSVRNQAKATASPSQSAPRPASAPSPRPAARQSSVKPAGAKQQDTVQQGTAQPGTAQRPVAARLGPRPQSQQFPLNLAAPAPVAAAGRAIPAPPASAPPRASLLAWGPLANMDPSQRMFTLAMGVSVVLHAMVLSIHFNLPQTLLKQFTPPQLEVVLVNAKSRTRPVKPDVLAQANLDGGGNVDENRRAKSNAPVTNSEQRGDDLKQAQQRVRELEAQQREWLAQMKASPTATSPTPAPSTEPTPRPTPSGADLVARSMQQLKLEAEISRSVDEYNKRPQKLFIGARAAEFSAAQYLSEWTQKVERWGNLNYPDMARGKFYGDVQFQVTLKPDGSVVSYEQLHSSGSPVLDSAARSIVLSAAPYGTISANVLRGNDLLVITRTMIFARGDRVFSN